MLNLSTLKGLNTVSMAASVLSLTGTLICTLLKPKLEQARIQEEIAKVIAK